MRVLLFTDTLGDVNGVSRFIRNASEEALRTGRDLTVVTSTGFEVPAARNIVNLKPRMSMRMPRYEQLELALPPVGAMVGLAMRMRPDVIHVSTPGPVGWAGWLAAWRLGVPLVGVYHTDFPAYVSHLFDDSMGFFTTGVMRAFYARFAAVLSRSESYSEPLRAIGVEPGRRRVLHPGIMTEQFHPRFADRAAMDALTGISGVRVLYAGRVSVEKNLPLLVKAWVLAEARLARAGIDAGLVVVGDGPYTKEMKRALAGKRAAFLGFRHGEELAMCFASSDLFVFPSKTDTLGQVVMEAQASGLAAVVSSSGGPKEIVQDGRTGVVVSRDDAEAWAEAIVELVRDRERRERMGAVAHREMQAFSFSKSFDAFWRAHEWAMGRG